MNSCPRPRQGGTIFTYYVKIASGVAGDSLRTTVTTGMDQDPANFT
ncbi:hypothetical protein Oter_4217 [Opitutus terrae PB90-1]|uniref:Uncharacterized protein n=1 Tax=Opitutus terrae (strain DSM 11246 / JCM 15787 / PB90-1) TaxID=452637 RepID=B1ZP01_OPITP|nr:hypothetical protein Oter_4217 [Opitutus terrae PB90-1]